MIKVLFVSVISVVLIQILKSYKPEYSILVKLTAIILIAYLILNEFNRGAFTFSFLSDIDTESVSYLPIIIKTLGIVIVTQISSNICRDSGEEALATVTELIGRVLILITCIPLFEALYILAKGYLEY